MGITRWKRFEDVDCGYNSCKYKQFYIENEWTHGEEKWKMLKCAQCKGVMVVTKTLDKNSSVH